MEVAMRNVTIMLVVLAAGGAWAESTKGKDSAASARAFIDKADAAFNAHDAKAMVAMLDKTVFAAGALTSQKWDGADAYKAHLEQIVEQGGRVSRDALTIKTDESGDGAWYIAEYTFIPKVPPGALPVHRKLREAGVLVRRGTEWKLAMSLLSMVHPDPPK